MFSPLRNRAGRRLREPFGKAGLTVAVIALVFAMLGGAYAATNGSSGGKATASAKGKPGPRGKTGKTGPAGPAGPAGPQGAAGAKGDKGDNGAPGSQGSQGNPGKSVVTGAATVGECANGGSTVEVEGSAATKKHVCNGAPGAPGAPGSPWTAGGTLPPEATETGTYVASAESGTGLLEQKYALAPISFPIPLPEGLDGSHAIFVTADPTPAECENSAHPGAASTVNPEAEPGYLCVFNGSNDEISVPAQIFNSALTEPGAFVSGAIVAYQATAAEAYATGTWAVTAATE